jgi:hypothetical protein
MDDRKNRRTITFIFSLVIAGSFAAACVAEEAAAPKVFVLDDFEGEIVDGKTVDARAGGGSSVAVSADTVEKHSGAQSLKIDYDAVEGGSIYVSRAVPDGIAWASYGAISFWMKGTGSGAQVALDFEDTTGEMYRCMVKDDAKTWKQAICPFPQFLALGDGQLSFPIKAFRFEPLAIAKGVIYIDDVSLEPLN